MHCDVRIPVKYLYTVHAFNQHNLPKIATKILRVHSDTLIWLYNTVNHESMKISIYWKLSFADPYCK